VATSAAVRDAAAAAGTAPVTEAAIQQLLTTKLAAEYVVARDTSGGCGQFFSILVVSPQFEGKPIMAQHRCVVSRRKRGLLRVPVLVLTHPLPHTPTAGW